MQQSDLGGGTPHLCRGPLRRVECCAEEASCLHRSSYRTAAKLCPQFGTQWNINLFPLCSKIMDYLHKLQDDRYRTVCSLFQCGQTTQGNYFVTVLVPNSYCESLCTCIVQCRTTSCMEGFLLCQLPFIHYILILSRA